MTHGMDAGGLRYMYESLEDKDPTSGMQYVFWLEVKVVLGPMFAVSWSWGDPMEAQSVAILFCNIE